MFEITWFDAVVFVAAVAALVSLVVRLWRFARSRAHRETEDRDWDVVLHDKHAPSRRT